MHSAGYIGFMKRAVNRTYIDHWVDAHYPDAISKLAFASKVPANTLNKIRNGYVPKDSLKRQGLAKVLGVTEDMLFPSIEEKAG